VTRSLFREAIRRTAVELSAGARVTLDEIATAAAAQHPDLIDAESERLVRNAVRREVKDVLRSMTEDDHAQASLPGLELPSRLAVRDERGDVVYVDTHVATLADLDAAEAERARNIAAAQRKLDTFQRSAARLRPYLTSPTTTIAEAVAARAKHVA
jgi:hypothetical protein